MRPQLSHFWEPEILENILALYQIHIKVSESPFTVLIRVGLV